MTVTKYLVDGAGSIPIEVFWENLDRDKRTLAYRMFEHGELRCEGRMLVVLGEMHEPNFTEVFTISKETWRDANKDAWFDWEQSNTKTNKLSFPGLHSDDIVSEIQVINSDQLREFVEFEKPSISVDELDDAMFKAGKTQIGATVWARAAAALASGKSDPTGRSLATYLLKQDDIWSNGEVTEDHLRRILSPFITEFKRLTQN